MKLHLSGMRSCAVALVLFLACCSSNDMVRPVLVSDYFPLKTGSWFVYAVDSVIISQGMVDSSSYQLKVRVSDTFIDGSGETTFALQRSKRSDSSASWSPLTTWSARASSYTAVVNEGNISFVKISTPVRNQSQWNGNALNAIGGVERCPGSTANTCDLYTIDKYGTSFADFPNTMTVVQNDDEDQIVFTDIRSEVYALNVGLVDRQVKQLEYCNSNCTSGENISKGLAYSQRLVSYGGF